MSNNNISTLNAKEIDSVAGGILPIVVVPVITIGGGAVLGVIRGVIKGAQAE